MRTLRTTCAAALLVVVGLAGGAQAAPDRTAAVQEGQSYAWTGPRATGVSNLNYWDVLPAGPLPAETCSKEATTYCDVALLELRNPLTAEQVAAGVQKQTSSAVVWIDGFGSRIPPVGPVGIDPGAPGGPVNDLDLAVYASDAQGRRGPLLASDGDLFNTNRELVTFEVTTTAAAPSQWVLVEVVYFSVVDSAYRGHVSF